VPLVANRRNLVCHSRWWWWVTANGRGGGVQLYTRGWNDFVIVSSLIKGESLSRQWQGEAWDGGGGGAAPCSAAFPLHRSFWIILAICLSVCLSVCLSSDSDIDTDVMEVYVKVCKRRRHWSYMRWIWFRDILSFVHKQCSWLGNFLISGYAWGHKTQDQL
jgi:hypothetical protein